VDAEFINVYIAKQKSWIEDLTAKIIMMEVRLQLAEARSAKLAEELTTISSKLEKNSKKKLDTPDSSF
jgi:hypothetical protein